MAYTPTTWNDGDIITKEKLNNVEQGIKTLDEDTITGIELITTGGAVSSMKITHSSGAVVTVPVTTTAG